MNACKFTSFALLIATVVCAQDLKGFDDTVLYDILWPADKYKDDTLEEQIIVTSAHKEKYRCVLPNIQDRELLSDEQYDGPTPLELISPLFSQSSCSFRIESYWTYEVCHGKYIRQYHEDREGKKVKIQEYKLGQWDDKSYQKLLTDLRIDELDKSAEIPVKKIDNVNLPYLEIEMENGTLCDLNNNKPRTTKVLYVCYVHGKNEVYSLKETSTCQYEIIILTPLLCTHPKYKPKETGENQINCVPLDGSPPKPYGLLKMKHESLKLRRNSDFEGLKVEFLQFKEEKTKKLETTKPPLDNTPVKHFLSGKNCLNGGTGWWKYEFCYGKTVDQYHIEKDGTKTLIRLGLFDKDAHLKWLEKHPHKRPKAVNERKQLSHFYSNGQVCDKTGKPRQTEVKLKCLENTANLNAVSLYLLEPKYCEYILGVESPLICDILSKADENGLVQEEDLDLDDSELQTMINIKLL